MRKSMLLERRIKLKKNHVNLVNDMQLEFMLPYLIQGSVLTFDMAEEIQSAVRSYAMNEKFLKMLPHRGDAAYKTFLDALQFGSGQMHLVDLLEGTSVLTEEVEELQEELNRRSRRCSCNRFSDDEYGNISPTRPPTHRNKSRLQVPEPNRPIKMSRKPRRKPRHKEELPDISHLLPYVIPHINKKWQQLAVALGLTEPEIAEVIVAPHDKLSRCTATVLDIWLSKDRSKATKQKLTQALTEIGAKKALDAISIYKVPKFKAKEKRKVSISSITTEIPGPAKLPSIINPDNRNSNKNSYVQLSSRLRRSGHLSIKGNIAKVSANGPGGIADYSQKVFLNIADKITDSMVERGDHATHILNTVEQLQGIIFHKVHKGSIILETQVMHLMALERLMKLYTSSELTTLLERVLVSEELLREHKVTEVKLLVQILPSEYEECKHHAPASETEFDGCSTTDDEDASATEDEAEGSQTNILVDRCIHLIHSTRNDLSTCLTQFDMNISELLMTLQLVHPPNVTRITTMDDLLTFRGYVVTHTPKILSTAAIDQFLDIHQQFIDKIASLKYQISSALFVTKAKKQVMVSAEYSKVEKCIERLIVVQRMLQPSYGFSMLTHPHTVMMTTMETLCYSGLLSYHYIILDQLFDAVSILTG